MKFTSKAWLRNTGRVKHNNYELQISFSGYSTVFLSPSRATSHSEAQKRPAKWKAKLRGETRNNSRYPSRSMFIRICRKTKKEKKNENNIADKNHNENLHFHLTCNCELCMVDYNFNVILLFFPRLRTMEGRQRRGKLVDWALQSIDYDAKINSLLISAISIQIEPH